MASAAADGQECGTRNGCDPGILPIGMVVGYRVVYRHRRIETRLDLLADRRVRSTSDSHRSDGNRHARDAIANGTPNRGLGGIFATNRRLH